MSRFAQRTALASLGLAALVLAQAPARADAPLRGASACAPAWMSERAACRAASRVSAQATVRTGLAPSRYVSLLILGVGY